MDLKDFILKVFPMKDDERYSKMIDNLKRLGFDSVSDLKYLDEESIKELEAFSRIEIKRLTDHLTKFETETLDDVLNEIFDGTPKKRIREIKIFLNEREIYVRKDILVINIMEMRKELFFSENEFLKIENFLQKYNNRYYEEIMVKQKLKESDLTPALYEIFSGADVSRISKIEEILKNQDITAEKHLVYIDIDKFKREKILADIEILKIESYLEENHKEQFEKNKERKEFKDSNNLKYVLDKVLYGTPLSRLEEIEEILKKEEIYSGKDILFTDLNGLQLKVSLSNAEMLKLEDYIKKNNLEHYEKIMRERELEKSKNLKYVLKQIYLDTPESRLNEIEKILNTAQIYSGWDVLVADTNNFREKHIFSEIEILKLEEHIRKYNRERYEDIRAVRQVKEERNLMQLKAKDEIEIMNLKAAEDLKRTECKERKELEIMELKRLKQQEMLELQMRGEQQLKLEQRNLTEAETNKEAKIVEINSKTKISEQHCQSLIEEKKSLLDELPKLEKDCIRLNKTVTEVESYKGYFGYGYSEAEKKKNRDEFDEMSKLLQMKRNRLKEIDKLITEMASKESARNEFK